MVLRCNWHVSGSVSWPLINKEVNDIGYRQLSQHCLYLQYKGNSFHIGNELVYTIIIGLLGEKLG